MVLSILMGRQQWEMMNDLGPVTSECFYFLIYKM